MFTDYAACVFISFGLTALATVAYGIGHLLKITVTALIRSLHSRTHQLKSPSSGINTVVIVVGAATLSNMTVGSLS